MLTDQGWKILSSHQMTTARGPGITIIVKKQLAETNIVIFEVEDSAAMAAKLAEVGIRTSPFSPTLVRMVTHLDITDDMLDYTIRTLKTIQL